MSTYIFTNSASICRLRARLFLLKILLEAFADAQREAAAAHKRYPFAEW
jgi:hypothetical protein